MNGAYHVAKFGIEAVGDVFRQELRPWGISVSIVEPGSIDDPDLGAQRARDRRAGRARARRREELYGKQVAAIRRVSRSLGERGIPPEKVARAIEHALTARRPRTRYLVGLDAKIQARAKHRDPDPGLRPDRRPRDRLLGASLPGAAPRPSYTGRTD